MGDKEHPWRLHNRTFWNIRLISNSKRLEIFLGGVNQVPRLYLDQNLLLQNSHVNMDLDMCQTNLEMSAFYQDRNVRFS